MEEAAAEAKASLAQLISSHQRGGRAAVDALLEALSLSPWDILYLRQRANSTLIQFATWTDLPLEILSQIVGYMSDGDLLRCRQASSTLRKVLMQDTVLMPFLGKNYPGAVEINQGHLSMEDVLVNVMHCYARRIIPPFMNSRAWLDTLINGEKGPDSEQGDYQFLVQRGPGCVGPDGRARIGQALYGDGKVAWQTIHQAFCVWTLKGHHHAIYTLPLDRRRPVPELELVALTGQLLVVLASSSPERLHIFEFESSRWFTVALSAPLHQCYAHKTSVIAVCRNRQAVSWSSSHNACVDIQLQDDRFHAAPDSCTQPMMQPGALFHPLQEDVIFLVWIYKRDLNGERPWIGRKISTVVIIKYRSLGNGQPFVPVERFECTIPHPVCQLCAGGHAETDNETDDFLARSEMSGVSMRVSDSMRKVNDFGAYSLFYFYLSSDEQKYSFESCECYNAKQHLDHIKALCFNVLSETFWEPRLSLVTARFLTPQYGPRRGIFSSSVKLADQVQMWNKEFLALSWPSLDVPMAPILTSTEIDAESTEPKGSLQNVQEDNWDFKYRSLGISNDDAYRLYGDDDFLVSLTSQRFLVHWREDEDQQEGRQKKKEEEEEKQSIRFVEDDIATVDERLPRDVALKDKWFRMHPLNDLQEIANGS